MQKKKKFRHHFKNKAKKTNKNVKFYFYLRLINIFERITLDARSY